jgi:hypothetical protein
VYENNMEIPPSFTDTADMDYTLSLSPCINSGSSAFISQDYLVDILGNPRIYSDAEAKVDMGAYEYQGPTPNRQPYIKKGEDKDLLRNVRSKIEAFYYDPDVNDDMTFSAWEDDPHVSVETFINDSSIIVEIDPEQGWMGDFYLKILINDNAGAINSVYNDSVLIHIGDKFHGAVYFNTVFRDTVKEVLMFGVAQQRLWS